MWSGRTNLVGSAMLFGGVGAVSGRGVYAAFGFQHGGTGKERRAVHLCAVERRERRAPATAAFSLIEVLCAILILGVALVGLTQGLTVALHSTKESEQQTTAALYAAGQIEILRAEGGLEDGETEGDCGEGLALYRWKQTIAPAGIDGLHQVAVTIENTNSSKVIYELQTMLFEAPDDLTAGSSDKDKPSRAGAGRRSR